ncbi:hypothetical protein JCM24511_06058 [Saitozyma sp. JCM 24511]|nr:hypothetical protein JCM24511_06058 [Saitozyma sp. JCM 24511]
MPTDRTDLLESLEKHNAAFTTLLSLIPSQYYIAPTQEEADSKWMKNKKRKTGEEIKEHKRRAKASKLDPENNKTTVDILFGDSSEPSSSSGPGPQAASSTSKPARSAQIPASSSTPGTHPGPSLPPSIAPLPPTASISDLRSKLASKLAGFRRDRGVDDAAESRDALEAERRARRGEMRDKRRNERKEERRKAKAEPTAKPAKTQLIVPALPRVDTVSYPSVSLPSGSSSGKSKAPLKALSNPSQALAHLQKHQTHLAGLPAEKRAEIEERERWAKAEERAAGGKVADNEKVLKNAVKRMEKAKAKGGKEWAERKRDLDKSQAVAMKKRNDNIAARAEARKNKRLGIKDKGAKKGMKKGRPGFEGKKGKGGGGKKGGASTGSGAGGKAGGAGGKAGGGAGGKGKSSLIISRYIPIWKAVVKQSSKVNQRRVRGRLLGPLTLLGGCVLSSGANAQPWRTPSSLECWIGEVAPRLDGQRPEESQLSASELAVRFIIEGPGERQGVKQQ